MDKKTVRIFLACSVGAIAGLAAAMALPHIIWWLGALAGAGAGGLIYAFREIKHYAPEAARFSWHALSFIPKACSAAASLYRAAKNANAVTRWTVIAVCMLFATLASWITGIVTVPTGAGVPGAYLFSVLFGGLVLVVIAFYTTSTRINADSIGKTPTLASVKRGAFFASPLGPPVWILMNLVPAVYETGKFFAVFTKTLFVYVHSKELVLCAVDSGLTVAVSYPLFVVALGLSAGPTLLAGGLVGGMLGVVNYEILSKRVLHLVPVRKS
jgi:hypothetical protein